MQCLSNLFVQKSLFVSFQWLSAVTVVQMPKKKDSLPLVDHKGMKQREGFSTWHVGMILASLLCKGKNWAFIRWPNHVWRYKKKSDGKEGVKWWLLGHLSFFLWGLGHDGFSWHIHVCQRGSKRSNHATSEEAGPLRPFLMKNRSSSSRYWTGSTRQAPNPMHESEMLWPKVQNDVSY